MYVKYNDIIERCLHRIQPLLKDWRRDLHAHPEPGWAEFRTAALVIAHLQRLGFRVRMGTDACAAEYRAGVPAVDALASARQRALEEGAEDALVARMGEGFTGCWADLDCGAAPDDPDVALAFRFDMDCNELAESQSLEHRPRVEGFASRHDGWMHACGHDGHVAIGMGLAEMLAVLRPHLRGRIRLLFQPAEEGARGALSMVKAGAVDNVKRLVGMHLGFRAEDAATLICGTRGFLATTKRDVVFRGKAAHAAAAPEEGKNALLAACTATLQLHAIPRSGKGVTRIAVGRLEGGQARNIVPSEARLQMETRGGDTALNAYMVSESERILQASAAMWDCHCEWRTVGSSQGGDSSPELAREIEAVAADSGLFPKRILMGDFGATEDFACLMDEVQRCGGVASYIQVGTVRAAGHHDSLFDFDESCLERAVRLLALFTCRVAG